MTAHCGWYHSLGLDPKPYKNGDSEWNNGPASINSFLSDERVDVVVTSCFKRLMLGAPHTDVR